ncbi:hypothetical protein SUGI_1043460 [Cryptomeria japonica]|nr:hypothetical protein SUGI_1043460 [Cryptomeria japonica]
MGKVKNPTGLNDDDCVAGRVHSRCNVGNMYQILEDWSYERARSLFKEPLFTLEESQPDLKWIALDEEGLKNFLVNENGFNHERVTKCQRTIDEGDKRYEDIGTS